MSAPKVQPSLVRAVLACEFFEGVIVRKKDSDADTAEYDRSGLSYLKYDPDSKYLPYCDEDAVNAANETIQVTIELKQMLESLSKDDIRKIKAKIAPEVLTKMENSRHLHEMILTKKLNVVKTYGLEMIALWSKLYHESICLNLATLLLAAISAQHQTTYTQEQMLKQSSAFIKNK
jgi:hypothetical protein